MWRWISKLFGISRPSPVAGRRPIRARYDAAQTTEENRRHWANADTTSAASAHTVDVRSRLRSRSRYERDNNGYAGGLHQTLANDLIGVGPTLQCEVTQVVEKWKEWCEAVGLTETLHTAKQAKSVDGEAFALLLPDTSLPGDVKLDVQLVECDRVTDPTLGSYPLLPGHDGIDYGPTGRPIKYTVLDYHPGDLYRYMPFGHTDYPAAQVIHWFRKDRPGQLRGIPELTASLPIFAQLRRLTLATLTAAEVAANFSALLETDLPPDGGTEDPTPFETLEIERGMMVTLPAGSKMHQLEAQHPTAEYKPFKTELLKELGRPVNAPYNIVAGDSSEYNYSSARLELLRYQVSIKVEREHCRRNVLERIFAAWYREAALVYSWDATIPLHTWFWPGFPIIDPLKEAKADEQSLLNGTTTLEELLAEHGQAWVLFVQQRAKELALQRSLGILPDDDRLDDGKETDDDASDD